jgi:GNAT superfamily N-acetyltransferase
LLAIRPMTSADTAAALAIFAAVGWGDRSAQVSFFTSRPDSALLVADDGGRVIGCSGATVFGPAGAPRTGWIHNVVVDPAAQRSGAGRQLTAAAVDWLRARGVPTALLLATPAGRPVYERMGFQLDRRYLNFRLAGADAPLAATSPGLRRAGTDDVQALLALDRQATGEDRSAMLRTFVEAAWVVERAGEIAAFHVPCPWREGPCVARDPASGALVAEASHRLLGSARRAWSVPEANRAALDWLTKTGAEPTGFTDRMWLGEPPPAWRPDMIYGVFNRSVA